MASVVYDPNSTIFIPLSSFEKFSSWKISTEILSILLNQKHFYWKCQELKMTNQIVSIEEAFLKSSFPRRASLPNRLFEVWIQISNLLNQKHKDIAGFRSYEAFETTVYPNEIRWTALSKTCNFLVSMSANSTEFGRSFQRGSNSKVSNLLKKGLRTDSQLKQSAVVTLQELTRKCLNFRF